MDVDSKEDYFMDLLLNRHARKLLTAHSLRDLGRFSAHLDFPLTPWLAREGHRAAKVEDFPFTLQQLHREFQWPFPLPCHHGSKDSPGSLFSPASTLRGHTPKDMTTPIEYVDDDDDGQSESRHDSTNAIPDEVGGSGGSSIRRAHRPPNLDLSPSRARELEQQSVTLEPSQASVHSNDPDFDPTQSSTPSKRSGSISEKVSLIMKNNPSKKQVT